MNDDLTYQNQLESLYDWPNENTNNSNTFLVKYTQICSILIILSTARGVIAVYHIAQTPSSRLKYTRFSSHRGGFSNFTAHVVHRGGPALAETPQNGPKLVEELKMV